MTDEGVAELHARLTAGKRTPVKVEYPFNRGWNAAIDFAIRQMQLTCDEQVQETKEAAE